MKKNSVSIGNLILSWNRGDGPRTGFYTDDTNNGVYFLRVNNLKEHSIDLTDVKYIHREVHETTLQRAKVTAGDLIFAISGTKDNLGTVSILPSSIKEANLNSALVRLDLDESKITKKFFSYFFDLNIARRQIEFIGKGAAQNNLNNEEISDIRIPLPSIEIQKLLVAEIEVARQNKKQKLDRAEELLSSIDSYLLNKLGLTLPEKNSQKIFAINLKDARPRFDVDYHTTYFQNLRSMIENSLHKVLIVSDLCINNPMTGFAAGQNKQAFNEAEGVPHIRPLNINSSGELHFEETKYVLNEAIKKDSVIKKNEVLFNNTNSMKWVGKSTIFDVDKICACSNHITRLTVKKDIVIPFFLANLFNALRSLGLFGLLSTNFNNQAGINIETLSTLRLPIPNITQQKRITQELILRKNKAKKLRQEAELEWETAKTRFEQKLLGEET